MVDLILVEEVQALYDLEEDDLFLYQPLPLGNAALLDLEQVLFEVLWVEVHGELDDESFAIRRNFFGHLVKGNDIAVLELLHYLEDAIFPDFFFLTELKSLACFFFLVQITLFKPIHDVPVSKIIQRLCALGDSFLRVAQSASMQAFIIFLNKNRGHRALRLV